MQPAESQLRRLTVVHSWQPKNACRRPNFSPEVNEHFTSHFQLLGFSHRPLLSHCLQTLTGIRNIDDSQRGKTGISELRREPALRFVELRKDNLFCGHAPEFSG
jgi:hypothetical protein